MTNPAEAIRISSQRVLALCVASAVCVSTVLVGCEEKAAAPSASTQAAPSTPAPKPRALVTLDGVKLHDRLEFPEERLPSSQEMVDPIVKLASAIAAGDSQGLSQLLGPTDNAVLKSLVESGQWKAQSDAIEAVRVCVVNESASGLQIGLGVRDKMGSFLTAWEGQGSGESWTFRGIAIEPRTAADLRELDGVELRLLGAPAPKPVASGLKPTEQNTGADEKKKDAPPPRAPGGLERDKF